MKIFRVLSDHQVEVACGLVLVASGVFVASVAGSSQAHHSALQACGAVLTTFGGILISWVASRAYTREQARLEFGLQLANLSRNLGQAAGQINRAVEQAQLRELTPVTGFALISQANRMIYGQVNEIAVIQGERFDPAYLLETASKLDEVAVKLERQGPEDESLSTVRRELEGIRSVLKTGPGSQARVLSPANVTCPFCNAANELEVGNIPGDTAAGTCAVCHERYNAHRSADGSVFTRRPGNLLASAPKRWEFQCPACDTTLSTRDDGTKRAMFCSHCYAALTVDLDLKQVFVGEKKYAHTLAVVVGDAGGRPELACPVCGVPRKAVVRTDTGFMAVCRDDLQLMEVTEADWEVWRENANGVPRET